MFGTVGLLRHFEDGSGLHCWPTHTDYCLLVEFANVVYYFGLTPCCHRHSAGSAQATSSPFGSSSYAASTLTSECHPVKCVTNCMSGDLGFRAVLPLHGASPPRRCLHYSETAP